MRIFLTGAEGQLGHELVAAFADHEVVATDVAQVDITDRAAADRPSLPPAPTWWCTRPPGPQSTPARATPTGRSP